MLSVDAGNIGSVETPAGEQEAGEDTSFHRLLALEPPPEARLDQVEAAAGSGVLTQVAGVLAQGDPGAAADSIVASALELADASPSDLYWAAVRRRVQEPDVAALMAELEVRLVEESAGDAHSDRDTELLLSPLAFELLPLAGLDLAAATGYARVFCDNYPLAGRALGDMPERAADWLARLLDQGDVRPTLGRLLSRVGQAYESRRPLAADRCRLWGSQSDLTPTQDRAWMRAMLALARTQE